MALSLYTRLSVATFPVAPKIYFMYNYQFQLSVVVDGKQQDGDFNGLAEPSIPSNFLLEIGFQKSFSQIDQIQSGNHSQHTHRYFKIFQHILNYGRILVGRENCLNMMTNAL